MTTAEQETKKQTKYGYRVQTSCSNYGEYAHAYVQVMKPHEWRKDAWEIIGEFRFQCDKENDYYGDMQKQRAIVVADGYLGWYSGEKVEELSGDNVDDQLENMRILAGMYKKAQGIIDKYNLRYKYDKPTSLLAAFNRMGMQALKYSREVDLDIETGQYAYYK